YRHDVRRLVAIGVPDPELRTAEHAPKRRRFDTQPRLLSHFAHHRVGRTLVRIHGAAGCDPDAAVRVPYQQHAPRIVADEAGDRWNREQGVPPPGAHGAEVLRDRHHTTRRGTRAPPPASEARAAATMRSPSRAPAGSSNPGSASPRTTRAKCWHSVR